MFRADLHCHTTCSDGSYNVKELLNHAKEIGLSGISITDHDTIAAYPTALEHGKELGLEVLTGAEFSTQFRGENIHVLAYGFAWNDFTLSNFCIEHRERRANRAKQILNKLKKHGMNFSFEELVRHRTIVRPHIAALLVKKGFTRSIDEAFKKFIGDKGCCFVPGEPFTTEATLDVIKAAGGVPVLAHPHLIKSKKIVKALLELPFEGIEAYYARFPLDREQRWLDLAKEKGLLVTGGSDFHGSIKPDIPLGVSWVDEEAFRSLQSLADLTS